MYKHYNRPICNVEFITYASKYVSKPNYYKLNKYHTTGIHFTFVSAQHGISFNLGVVFSILIDHNNEHANSSVELQNNSNMKREIPWKE